MSEPDSDLGLGTVLDDRYELDEEIARGGFGRVYRARQINIDREVAVKMLPPKFMDLDDVVERFKREARLASRLSHPNTITVHDYGQHGDFLFLVMELLEGEDLADILARRERVSLDRIARIARQVLKSLHEAHQHNIIHRDLKPENIFLTEMSGEQDFVKVVDFGIAKLAMSEMTTGEQDSHRSLTVEGNTVGTPTYMSPEQAAGGDVDARSDLYGLGVILYEMAAGRPPFDHDDPAKLMRQHIFQEVPAFEDDKLRESWLESVVGRALEKEKEDRFQDANEFLEAIDYALQAAEDGRAFAPTREHRQVERDGAAGLQAESDQFFPADNQRSHTLGGTESRAAKTTSDSANIQAPSRQSNTSSSIVTVLEPSPDEDVILLDEPKESAPSETDGGSEISSGPAASTNTDPSIAGKAPTPGETDVPFDGATRKSAGDGDGEMPPEPDSPSRDETSRDREPSLGADESWSWDDSAHLPDDDFQTESYTTSIDRSTNWGALLVWLLVVAGAALAGYLYVAGDLV